MEYNTQRKILQFPEYGRNITQLVAYAQTVESREERTKVAEAIVNAMAAVCPKVRETAHWKLRLWGHLMIMSDWKLDVDVPVGVTRMETVHYTPEKLTYKNDDVTYRHYGRFLPALLEAIQNNPDEEEKQELIDMTANLMKRLYLTWNNEGASDEVILEQLDKLSHGTLTPSEGFQFLGRNTILEEPWNGTTSNTGSTSGNKKKKKKK